MPGSEDGSMLQVPLNPKPERFHGLEGYQSNPCKDVWRMGLQGAFASGHLLPEGVGKALALATILAILGVDAVWLAVIGLPVAGALALLGGLPVQFNYVARSGPGKLPEEYQRREGFEEAVRVQAQGKHIKGYVYDEESQRWDYQLSHTRRLQALSYVIFATMIESCDGAVAGYAVLPTSWNVYFKLALGLFLGCIKAIQYNLIYNRRGWENMAADQAIRHGEIVAPLETYLGLPQKSLERISKFLSVFTPQCFGFLHVIATAELHTKLHEWLIQYLGLSTTAVLKYGSRPLMYLFTAVATSAYDIRNLGKDVMGDDSLVTEYPTAKWIERNIFRMNREVDLVGDYEVLDPTRLERIFGGYGTYFKQHPVEAMARHIYGESLARTFNILLPGCLAVFTESIWFAGGLFMLFAKALHTVYEELISKLIGATAALSWSEQLFGPHTTFTLIALLGTLAQFKQKWPALAQKNKDDNGHAESRSTVFLRVIGAFTTMAVAIFAMGQLRGALGSETTEDGFLFENSIGILTTVVSQLAFFMGANWDYVAKAGVEKAKACGQRIQQCCVNLCGPA